MTDLPRQNLGRRINLLVLMMAAGWVLFALALAIMGILLGAKIRLANNDLENQLDTLSRQLAELKTVGPGTRPGADHHAAATVATNVNPSPAPATGSPTSRPEGALIAAAGGSTLPVGPATSLPEDHATLPAPPDESGRPAKGLAGWFADLKSGASFDPDNPLFRSASLPKTVATALAEIAKVTPADATAAKISADEQVIAAQLFLTESHDAEHAHAWAAAVAKDWPRNGRAWFFAGLASYQGKQLDAAAVELTHATELLADRPEPFKALCEIYLKQAKLDKALEVCRQGVAAAPADMELATRLGDVLVLSRQFDEAIKQYRRVLAANGKLSNVRARLAQLLVETDHAKDAIDVLDAAPPNAAPEARLGVVRGSALLAQNDLPGAEAALAKAVEQSPLAAEGWFLLGKARLMQHKPDAAVVALERAVAVDSTMAEAWKYLGVALANAGKLDDAIAKLAEAVRLNVASAEVHYTLAVLYLWKKQPDAALAALRQAVKLDKSCLAKARTEPVFTNEPTDSAIGKFLKEGS